MPKKVVVVLYEYFYPGYKAGGPIQSLVNMIDALNNEFDFRVITTAFDLNDTTPYTNIFTNSWNDVTFTDKNYSIKVWYSTSSNLNFGHFRKIIHEANPSIIYINGLFTNWFSKPLILYKFRSINASTMIVAPRGMLQKGALELKGFKKKVFIFIFKATGFFKNITWHATTIDEAKDIILRIGKKATIITALNIPKTPLTQFKNNVKEEGKLKLVYLSLITEKKNLYFLLEILAQSHGEIQLSIYGPIKDKAYWNACLQIIQKMPSHIHVEYKNDILPNLVQSTIQQYDAFISLTKGENFGHAIFEAFSCGIPVITSNFTPWNNLEKQEAGWNVDINDKLSIINLLNQLAMLNGSNWVKYNSNALSIAHKYYYEESNFIESYKKLFA